MRKAAILKLINFWPPYFGAGVRVTKISADMREIDVEMKLKFWNKNYVGTQFGGSLYSMVDPFYMLMLIENLGRDYIVWDKSASIRFKKPGQGRVRAQFRLDSAQIDEIKARADSEDKFEPRFQIQILDDSDDVIAEVEKLLYVRRKDKGKPRS
ncbi:MAG: DUF4442 domain-containing protein [Bdellovibrionia bacterium]